MANFPSAIVLRYGEICEKDDPPMMKQKKVLIMTAASYFPVSILSIINFLPYQNPKEYIDIKTKMINP